MYLLSKIIAKEWFKYLIGSITVLFLLVTVGDIVNGFMRNYSANRVILEYFLKMPNLMGKMLPISALLASLFAFNKLKSHAELIAILAGGFDARRIYTLIGMCAISVGLLQFLNLGFLMPMANKIKRKEFEKSRRNESKYLARSKIGRSGLLWYKSDNYFTSFTAYDTQAKQLKNVTVYFQNPKGKLQRVVKAESGKFLEPGVWSFNSVQELNLLDGKIFPKMEQGPTLRLELKEEPNDFNQFESDITTLNFFDLSGFINRLRKTGINSSEYQVMLLEKVSLSFICLLFALFPVSTIFNPNRRASGFGKSIVVTLVFSVVFWLTYSSVISFGVSGRLDPITATMGIPIIFTVFIAWVYNKNKAL
ncbi:MAG: hypothetical protein CME64_07035 [Halobacteriovoraceae bacterium]|nr:hypothetical protein [Halobacteriovoraceae bacterium]|tara:strand:- start:29884 stop:30975 length:1092 start_codon:yes stop_codon:yes gene_type:complete